MKNLLIIFGFFIVSFAAMAQEKKVAWDYPVKPGSEEWAAFTTGLQMQKVCQIPENILEQLSTNELVVIC
jgi:carbonic anhydrase